MLLCTLWYPQSMSSDNPEVLGLVSALATKISESRPILTAQAIGSALYGLQKLDSGSLEVRTLLSTLAEKIEGSTESWDAQAIASGLFGKIFEPSSPTSLYAKRFNYGTAAFPLSRSSADEKQRA